MFLFLKLYLAHLIADFILQFDELYRLKVQSRWGHFFHVLIYFVVSLLAVIPYLKDYSMWFFIAAVTMLHYFQDDIKYAVQKTPSKMFAAYMIDQVFHFLFIATILLLPSSRLELGFPQFPGFNTYYSDSLYTLLAILFILSTFAGSYTFYAWRQSYRPASRSDHYITRSEMTHAIIERTTVSFIFLFSTSLWLMAAAPLIGLLRLSAKPLRNTFDFVVSFVYAAAWGLLFRLWI